MLDQSSRQQAAVDTANFGLQQAYLLRTPYTHTNVLNVPNEIWNTESSDEDKLYRTYVDRKVLCNVQF